MALPLAGAICFPVLHRLGFVCMVWGPCAFFSLVDHTEFCYPLPPFVHPLTHLPSPVCTHVCSHVPPLRPVGRPCFPIGPPASVDLVTFVQDLLLQS